MTRFAAVLCLLISCGAPGQVPTSANQSEDEAAIRRVVAQSDQYWNQHEFLKGAELRTADSVDVNVVGIRSTHAEISQGLPPWFQKAFGKSTLHSTVIWIKFIRPDIAAVDTNWEMHGGRCPDGSDDAKSDTFRKGLMSLVMVKDQGEWRIAVFHNMDLPTKAADGKTEVPCQFH
jgi:uncharacterized protein (TIGR02246 family)